MHCNLMHMTSMRLRKNKTSGGQYSAMSSLRLRSIRLLAVPLLLGFASTAAPARAQTASIAAVVNGDVITMGDVENRARFFALATGQQVSPDVLQHLTPQILQQLINERLEIQEVERRSIVITDKEVAHAIDQIEHNNSMGPGTLHAKLTQLGIGFGTLVNQVRTQLGWTQVLRQIVNNLGRPSAADIDTRLRMMKEESSQPQYDVGEIFIPVSNPKAEADAQRFADTVIAQLRQGAPFPIIAAQFSQGPTALQGGALGSVGADELDPAVAQLAAQMPIGAISNPVPVAGGIVIVQLRGRQQGQQGGAPTQMLSLRQVFLPFSSALDQQHPTDQQRQTLAKFHAIAASVHSCADVEAANRANGAVKPADPGPVNLAQVSPPQFQALLSKLKVGEPSPPLLATDGVSLVMVCGTTTQADTGPSRDEIAEQIFSRRVSLAAQQTLDGLRRQASIQNMLAH
jgi:peptidyl-prolyl cis-trans isomerase SurA